MSSSSKSKLRISNSASSSSKNNGVRNLDKPLSNMELHCQGAERKLHGLCVALEE